LNIKGDDTRLITAHIFTLITTVIFYILIFSFWKNAHKIMKIQKNRKNVSYLLLKPSGHYISDHYVMLRGIPKHIDPVEVETVLFHILKRSEVHGTKISGVRAIGDYRELWALGELWKVLDF
jgi:hypothetical protein